MVYIDYNISLFIILIKLYIHLIKSESNLYMAYNIFEKCAIRTLILELLDNTTLVVDEPKLAPSQLLTFKSGSNKIPGFLEFKTKNNIFHKYIKCKANFLVKGSNNSISNLDSIIGAEFGSKTDVQIEYKNEYTNIFFVFVGNFEWEITQTDPPLMSKLLRYEYPNHWFYVSHNNVKYICLRCLQPLHIHSEYEFNLWTWSDIFQNNINNVISFTKDVEKTIGTLFWWDYFHLPIWKHQIKQMINYGPRHVLEHIVKQESKFVPSDIIVPLALGRNQTLDYGIVHSFFRQTQQFQKQSIQIPGAPYLTLEQDSGHSTGTTGMWQRNFDLILSTGNDYKFMSCSPVTGTLISFSFYLEPFHLSVWLIIITIIPILTIISIETTFQWTQLFSFFGLTLIEVPIIIPKDLNHNKNFLFLFVIWELTSVILSNGYKSVLTNYVVAPLKDSTPTTWTHLLNLSSFLLFMADGSIPTLGDISFEYGVENTPNTRLSKDVFTIMRDKSDQLALNNNTFSKIDAMNQIFHTTPEGLLYNRIKNIVNFNYAAVEHTISQCEESVMVDTTRVFEKFIKSAFPKRSSKVNKFFRISEDTFKGSVGWMALSRFGNPVVKQRLRWIVESGLFDMWKCIFEFGNIFQKMRFKSDVDFEPQTLISNIATVFILYVLLVFGSVIVFLGEFLDKML